MRAAVLRDYDAPLRIEDVDVAAPIGAEVLVRTAAASICHSDLSFLTGAWPHPLPTILGHEVAGVVEAVGPDVVDLAPGDHVVGASTAPCGRCRYCVAGRPTICPYRCPPRPADALARLTVRGEPVHQFAQLSAFAERLLAHEQALVAIPRDVPLGLAAVLPCAVASGVGAVLNTARVAAGESVVVLGCGGVGLNAVQGARIAGAGPIVAVDVAPAQLELAIRLGAHEAIDASSGDPVAAVRALLGDGADHVIEASGVPMSIDNGFRMLGPGGAMTCIGVPPAGTTVAFDISALVPAERVVRGSRYGSLRPRVDLPRYAEMYRRGELDLETVASRRVTLDGILDGFAAMSAGGVARVVIDFATSPS